MNFWEGKRVLVTGHTGFKGSWLVKTLKIKGAQISGLSLSVPTSPSLFESSNIQGCLVEDNRYDIRNFENIREKIKDFDPEIIFHLAAQPLVRKSYLDPFETYSTNVMGTLNVLMAALEAPSLKSVVNITTDKCYENKEWIWPYRETDHLGGHDPYSSSKACAEILSSSINKSFLQKKNVNMCTVRAGNVIGGGDWAEDRIIPDLGRAFKNNKKLSIRNPLAVRPWQHVMEPVLGYMKLAEKCFFEAPFASAWNFGPDENDCIKVKDVVENILSYWPSHPGYEVVGDPSQLHEANILKLDCSKSKSLLGWSPVFSLGESLKLTADWYRAFFEGKDIEKLTEFQINQFLNRENPNGQ